MIFSTQLLEETKQAFQSIRSSMTVAMQKLHEVHASNAWEDVCSSWSEYVESELGISQSFASKLLSVNKHYVLEGGYSHENLAGVDLEKLNMARQLPGTPEEQLSMARTLTRTELKQTKNDQEVTPHEAKWITYCDVCKLSQATHP